ncbi:HpcH/HpaI aldolase family protein [Roseobacter sinensis]|uniref:Aldolase/citrate lyase family protein n=1 Tax=Roseobacter sinensis TaxID=2931391 RepID=A0ABT3BKG7_9RHOB|nr:aldolase/citrate lyase family protein [Roseobacter sp. WL0113]MCV3274072.1 aldolase/citrate lyase family protein [Roseobacter sp. WL0113]
MTRDLKSLLVSETTHIGTWTQIAAPEMVDLIGLNGFEFTIIDCQHGPFGIETAENLARAADANDIAVALRVARNDPVEIMKALDAGIRHVVVPNVETAEQAGQAVAATRFGPHGLRGACPCCRSGGHFIRNWEDYVIAEETRTGAIALVETAEGHRNIGAICTTPGLSALMVGPFDLAVSMGLNGNWRDRAVIEAAKDMLQAAKDAGLPAIMPVFAPSKTECAELIAEWRSYGVSCFVIGSDKIIVAEAFAAWSSVLTAQTKAGSATSP